MSNNPVSARYYPALSELITVDDLPDFLQFAETGLENLLSRIHYKDFQFSKSARGDAAFYSLEIVANELALDLPFGLKLVLNPSADDANISSFPISIQYQWELLAFLRGFNLQNFAFTPEAFFQLGLEIFKISDAQVIAHTLNYFVESENGTDGKFEEVINTINDLYPTANLALPVGEEPTVEMVTALITNSVAIPDSVSKVMFLSYVLDTNLAVTKSRLEQFYALMVPDGIENYIRRLIKPKLRTTLTLSAGIQFPPNILRPINSIGEPVAGEYSLFKFGEATFYADTEAGIGTNVEFSGSLFPTQYVHEIGKTGLTISIVKAKLDLSSTTNIPEADAAGYPADFTGLYVEKAEIGFNRFGSENTGYTSANIYAENLLVGNGGVTGTIGLESNGALYRKFGNFAVELNHFSMTFRQGSIVSSEIRGELTLPIFKNGNDDAKLAISASIYDDGNFKITAQPLTEPYKIRLPNVFEFRLRSVEMGKTDRGHYLEVAGWLDFIGNIPGLGRVLPADIEIDSLRIWDNGDLEFKSGVLRIKRTFKFKAGPVNIEVSDIHIGAYRDKAKNRGYHYFGFDGMVNGGRSGFKTSGNGIKYYFTTDGGPFDHFLRIDGIDINMAIPDKKDPIFLLEGHLSMSNPSNADSIAASEYTGSVKFSLPKLSLSGAAGMRMNPSVPAFLVDVGLELANPVPIGGTGLGIYGFRGIIGQHYMPHKAETASWWDYYKAKSAITGREGVELDKFASKSGFSFGAGLSIATSFDSGKIFSSKLFMLLGLPDVFLIQGQAGILRERIGLMDDVDPPFSALIIFGNNSVRGNLAVDYYLPEGSGARGKIFELHGQLDMAFYFNNASGWYINVGKDKPETERVSAKVLTLFKAHAYLMLSMQGIKAGAGARFDFRKRFLGVSVGFGAYLNLGGFISFKPVQIGGFIAVGAYVYFKIWKFKLGFDINAMLAVEAPNPFNIIGSFQIRINLPWPFKDLKIGIDFSWKFNNNIQPLINPISILELPNPAIGYLPAAATHILTGETFGINYMGAEGVPNLTEFGNWAVPFEETVIPLDSFIDIELLKPVKPGAVPLGGAANQLPTGYIEHLPPSRGPRDQVKHEFSIAGLQIKAWNATASQWQDYHVYQAVTAIVNSNAGAIVLSDLKQGYWQFQEPGRFNKIRLLSQHMFSYSNKIATAENDLTARNFSSKAVFCFKDILNQLLVNWKDETLATVYPQAQNIAMRTVNLNYSGLLAHVVASTSFSGNVLELSGLQGSVSIRMPKPMGYVRINFGKREVPLRITYYKTVERKVGKFSFPLRLPMGTENVAPGQEPLEVLHNDLNTSPVDEIVVSFNPEIQLDFVGPLVMGGSVGLPETYELLPGIQETFGAERGLFKVALYNHSFTSAQVLTRPYQDAVGAVAAWPMTSVFPVVGGRIALQLGTPDKMDGYWTQDGNLSTKRKIYQFVGNTQAMVVPYHDTLKVENASFAIETNVVFKPEKGLSTLMYKLAKNDETGSKKGFSIHLLQENDDLNIVFPENAEIPASKLIFTFFGQKESTSITIEKPYVLDCKTRRLVAAQYMHLMISVNRADNLLEIFVDGVSRYTGAIPQELATIDHSDKKVHLHELGFMTPEQNQSLQDNGLTQPLLIEEVEILENGISKAIQPVWRPNTKYMVLVTTKDAVSTPKTNYGTHTKTYVYGFMTAGPIGHFHQHSKQYEALEREDRSDEFRLKNLRSYIDFQRSSPDAQGRMDISKPVYFQDPKVQMFFTKDYVTAMFSDWDNYLGLDPIESRLSLNVVDNNGSVIQQLLQWEPDIEMEVNDSMAKSLPPDLKILYLLNKAASLGACDGMQNPMKKKLKRGSYSFEQPLRPNELYTAIFSAIYKVGENGSEQNSEVHRFNFLTSKFPSFQAHASSFVQGEQLYISTLKTSFTVQDIEDTLLPLIDNNVEDDPIETRHFASQFDKLVYGGLMMRNLESSDHISIYVLANNTPGQTQRILGLLVMGPEPMNDPKIERSLLDGTVGLTMYNGSQIIAGPENFKYIISTDTSSFLITNNEMNIQLATLQLKLKYKQFNGVDYETIVEEYQSPQIDMSPYII